MAIEREIDLVVEGVVAALIDVVHDTEWRKDNEAAEDISDHPPGPGAIDFERGRFETLPVHLCDVVAFTTERDCARRCEVQVVVDDDGGLRRVGEYRDRLFVGMHPGSAA